MACDLTKGFTLGCLEGIGGVKEILIANYDDFTSESPYPGRQPDSKVSGVSLVGTVAMRCPACGSEDTQVTETRVSEDGVEIRRRRRCLACSRRFKTVERIELSLPYVVKKNGARLEFDEKRLRASFLTTYLS